MGIILQGLLPMFAAIIYHMFAFLSGGYHPWNKFFIYHRVDVIMDYNAMLLK